jgi:hypothetical protein
MEFKFLAGIRSSLHLLVNNSGQDFVDHPNFGFSGMERFGFSQRVLCKFLRLGQPTRLGSEQERYGFSRRALGHRIRAPPVLQHA